MEQAPAYREGIEDSIRRCEELLALSPLALETSASGFRRSFTGKDEDAESSKECLGKVKEDELSSSSAEELWKRNMDLLISGNTKPHEKSGRNSEFQMDANKIEEEALHNVRQESQEPHENAAKISNSLTESKASASHRSHVTPCQGTVSPEGSAVKSSRSFVKSSVSSGNKCEWDSEWSAASSEWITNAMRQDLYQTPESQFINSSQSSQKSITKSETCERFHVILPLDTQSPSQSSINGSRSNKEMDLGTKSRSHAIEVTATRVLNSSEGDLSCRTSSCIAESDLRESDSFAHGKQSLCSSPDRFRSSENEENTSQCQSRQLESSSEVLPANTPEGSGISQIALGVTWDTSDRFTSPESEQRVDTTGSSSLEQTAEHVNLHRQQHRRVQEDERSRSVPKEGFMANRMPKYQRSKSVSKECCEDRLQTLARPRTEVYKKLAELKAILEKEKLQQCSFKPLVGRRPDPESMHSAPIIERILELQQRFGLRKRARKVYEKEELDNCSFWPRINFRSQVYDRITYQPIQDRFPELQRQKFEKIANAQLRMNMGLTFKPEINQKSIQLCKQKGLEMINVAERLSAMQPSVHLDCKVEPQKNQGTFAPEINKNTDYIISSSRQFKGCSVGFLKRQRLYMQTIEEKKRSF